MIVFLKTWSSSNVQRTPSERVWGSFQNAFPTKRQRPLSDTFWGEMYKNIEQDVSEIIRIHYSDYSQVRIWFASLALFRFLLVALVFFNLAIVDQCFVTNPGSTASESGEEAGFHIFCILSQVSCILVCHCPEDLYVFINAWWIRGEFDCGGHQ